MRRGHWLLIAVLGARLAAGAQFQGVVETGGVAVPGATVSITAGTAKSTTVTGEDGKYVFSDVPAGEAQLEIEMPGFAPAHQTVTVPAPGDLTSDLKMLSFTEIVKNPPVPAPPRIAVSGAAPPAKQSSFQKAEVTAKATVNAPPPPQEADPELAQKASDGLLINGSQNNGAASTFSLDAAFGNNRRRPGSLYTGNIGFILDNSTLDARSYSLTGQDTPKPGYDHVTGTVAFGGPVRIPHVVRNGPQFFVGYQWTRNRNANTQSYLVPTAAQRAVGGIDPAAAYLLSFYPLPNFNGNNRYNFQLPLVSLLNVDSLQSRLQKNVGRRDTLYGSFAFQRIAMSSTNLFGFLDTNRSLGLNADTNWTHRFGARLLAHFEFQFSRQSANSNPYFSGRANVSGAAGIAGNLQDAADWGPPTLVFASGIATLNDANHSFTANQTAAFTNDYKWIHGRHSFAAGGDFKRLQFNTVAEANPRGSFTFTGAATGSDFGDFLKGIPDTIAMAWGNADKYFRGNLVDAFVNDDWRVAPELTLNLGLRWEFASPLDELRGRLVNLALSGGYAASSAVTGNGSIHPDYRGVQPRIGFAWRPFPASSMVVRGGYGVYFNTSIYQNIISQMAQQAPLSRSVSVQNAGAQPLILESAFANAVPAGQQTFAVDPNLRVGYTQNWQLSVQRDLPGALVATATYNGIKGTRGMQESLPNSYPNGAANPCVSCPAGFIYLQSNGNSTLESGQFQLRRRLRSGLTATLQYTWAKAIDDSALGGKGQATNVIAQNWQNLSAERGLSVFDQRHLVNFTTQYTTGTGIGGGTLMSGWRGRAFKDWTVSTAFTAGTGLPLSPVYLAAVSGTGVTGPLRPDYTGAAVDASPAGLYLNPAAFAPPATGQWGNAGRNSITGPAQLTFNSSLARTFRVTDRINFDLRVDSTNSINHVTWSSWVTTINSAQFGLPAGANPMRSLQTTFRLRF